MTPCWMSIVFLFCATIVTRSVFKTSAVVSSFVLILPNTCRNKQQQQQQLIRKMSSISSTNTAETSSSSSSFIDVLSKAVSDSVERTIQLQPTIGGGYSGGGGASTSAYVDPKTNTKYFVKSAYGSIKDNTMLYAEYVGILEIYNTKTIKVPTPIAYGEYTAQNQVFVIFEYLYMSSNGGNNQYELGQQLALMHRSTSQNNLYGFHIDNTIGATYQPNLPWYNNWIDFFIDQRLNHMLSLTNDAGLDTKTIIQLQDKVRQILLSHTTVIPSLVHGDLWGGNKGYCSITSNSSSSKLGEVENKDEEDKKTVTTIVVPCIFDPATYYGDREVDIALSYLFGGYTTDFYKGYNDEWSLSSGHEQRRTIYNLYHILNHDVLFSGGYLSQAKSMIYEILRY